MSARIFIHPRCVSGPAQGALIQTLEAHGYDCQRVFIGPEDKRRRRELVRAIELYPDGSGRFARMDGSEFIHLPGQPAPEPREPEAA